MEDEDVDIQGILNDASNQGFAQHGEELAEEDIEQHAISSGMNVFQGVLNTSMHQTGEEPRIIVYEHSPGFNQDETGYGVVHGRNMNDSYVFPDEARHRVPQSTREKTGIIPLEVEDSEDLPGPHYEGSVEVLLEHDGMDLREDYPVTVRAIPYDPGSLNTADLPEVFDRYDAEQNDIERTDMV